MLDAAHLMEEEARRRTRNGNNHKNGNHETIKPLYSTLDALNCLDNFGRVADYAQALEIAPGIDATFIDAGHILGSASIFLELKEQTHSTSVLFSGDLGSAGRLLRSPATPPRTTNVVMEATYGNRSHKPLGPSLDELFEAITEAFKRGGNVIIPTFALERAQELLYFLGEGISKGRLAESTPVFLDSPMAISATEIFRRHPECFGPTTSKRLQDGHDFFDLPGPHFTRETSESMALSNIHGGAIIMAGSGMCTGGRVRHHLQHNLGRDNSAVVFVGYAATGTLARRIIDGAKQVSIFGEDVPVRARIYTINGFSAHADQVELLNWQKQTGASRVFLVHGEEGIMNQFAAHLDDTHVEMPVLNQEFEL
jgi:metallo-beta-lactamase family protein